MLSSFLKQILTSCSLLTPSALSSEERSAMSSVAIPRWPELVVEAMLVGIWPMP